ncbi:MAG TPA: hypothetical protein VGI70_14250, partial [Polyangiales bacterium]
TLLREIASADQPLVVGFVHEIAARIAHRNGDDSERESELGAMKRWYTSTRNPALLMRARRVIESMSEAKPVAAGGGDAAAGEGDREIVTRVTTRREVSSVEGLFEESASRQERCERALHFVIESAGGASGYLYLLGEDGAQLMASNADDPDDELERTIQEWLARPYADDQPLGANESAPIPLTLEAEPCERRGLFFLLGAGQTHALGAVLVCSKEEPIRPIPTDLLLAIARNLSPE